MSLQVASLNLPQMDVPANEAHALVTYLFYFEHNNMLGILTVTEAYYFQHLDSDEIEGTLEAVFVDVEVENGTGGWRPTITEPNLLEFPSVSANDPQSQPTGLTPTPLPLPESAHSTLLPSVFSVASNSSSESTTPSNNTLSPISSNQSYAPGVRVFFWASNSQVVYGTIQSRSRMPDGTLVLVIREDDGSTVSLPAAGVTIVN